MVDVNCSDARLTGSPNTLRSHGGSATASWMMVCVIRRGA
jgi:hypothetical protein